MVKFHESARASPGNYFVDPIVAHEPERDGPLPLDSTAPSLLHNSHAYFSPSGLRKLRDEQTHTSKSPLSKGGPKVSRARGKAVVLTGIFRASSRMTVWSLSTVSAKKATKN